MDKTSKKKNLKNNNLWKTIDEKLSINSGDLGWQIILILTSLVVFLSASEGFKKLFDKYIVNWIFSKFNDGAYSTPEATIYGILFIAILSIIWRKIWITKYRTKLVYFSFLAFACIIYWHLRYTQDAYYYYPLIETPLLGYKLAKFDGPFILLTTLTLILLINISPTNKYNKHTANLSMDLPLTDDIGDMFNRGIFIDGLNKIIAQIGFDGARGFAIALIAPWGQGKTSVLNILTNEICKQKDVILVRYNPWLANTSAGLTQDFFTTIETALSPHITTGSIIEEYGRELTMIDSDMNPLKVFSNSLKREIPLDERFEEVVQLIRRTHRRIFIIIDDLDRLDNDEVFELIKMIRNSGNFPRTHFIVAFDKNYVIHALNEKQLHNSEKYLDKIFDLEISLPKIRGENLQELLNVLLKKLFEHSDNPNPKQTEYMDQIFKLLFTPAYTPPNKEIKYTNPREYYPNVLTNARAIIKFTNSLNLVFSINSGHIFFPDLFILELIKLRDHRVYSKLQDTAKYLVMSRNSEGKRIYKLHNENNKSNDPYELISNLSSVKKVNLKEALDEVTNNLLDALFQEPDSTDFNSKKALCYQGNFDSYFAYNDLGISFEDLDTLIYQ
jgi:ABC-type dipeptide/oligopeptide/nickel transport system ATPase subunit